MKDDATLTPEQQTALDAAEAVAAHLGQALQTIVEILEARPTETLCGVILLLARVSANAAQPEATDEDCWDAFQDTRDLFLDEVATYRAYVEAKREANAERNENDGN